MVPFLVKITVGATIGALAATGIMWLMGVDNLVPGAVGASVASAIGAGWASRPAGDDDDEDDEAAEAPA